MYGGSTGLYNEIIWITGCSQADSGQSGLALQLKQLLARVRRLSAGNLQHFLKVPIGLESQFRDTAGIVFNNQGRISAYM